MPSLASLMALFAGQNAAAIVMLKAPGRHTPQSRLNPVAKEASFLGFDRHLAA
jgi:hypothetical protein